MAMVFRAESRFKNILCEISSEGDTLFMLDDYHGTVVYDSDLYAVEDEDFEKDVEAAKLNGFSVIPVCKPEGTTFEYKEI